MKRTVKILEAVKGLVKRPLLRKKKALESAPSYSKADLAALPTSQKRRGKGRQVQESELLAFRAEGASYLAGEIYRLHWPLVLGVALRYMPDRAMAEDAAAEILLKVLDRLRHETPRNFPAWLHMVAKYHCLELLRTLNRGPIVESIEAGRYLGAWDGDPEESEERRELLGQAVWTALAELPPHQKQCVELFYFDHLSYLDISEETGFTMKEVKSYIQNGKRRLAMILAPVRAHHISDCGG